MTADPYSPTGLADRCGALMFAVRALLEVIDESSVSLDTYDAIRVDAARRILDEQPGATAVAG